MKTEPACTHVLVAHLFALAFSITLYPGQPFAGRRKHKFYYVAHKQMLLFSGRNPGLRAFFPSAVETS